MPFPDAENPNDKNIYPKNEHSLEETFADNFISLGGKFVYCNDEVELLNNLYHLCENRGWKNIVCADEELMNKINTVRPDMALSAHNKVESAEACITNCEVLVARTGSAIISSNQNMGRTSTVFHPVHIIVAYSDQVTNDISDAISKIKARYGEKLPSMINVNSGPSRTADIEKTLVVGVHGPREVFCFFVNSI